MASSAGAAALNLGAEPRLAGQVLPKPTFSARCGLCETAFAVGDEYVSIWQKGARAVLLGITVHRRCWAQLAPGDLTWIFAALEQGLALPLASLRREHRVAEG